MISVVSEGTVSVRVAVVTLVSITVWSISVVMSVESVSSGLSISGPLAIVVAMMSVRVAIVAMMSITVPVVGQAISIMMTIVSISLSLGLGFSVSSDGCEKAESGNGNGFHLDCSLQARGVSWTPM